MAVEIGIVLGPRADADARHKRVVLVLDTLRGLEMTKIGIATVATDDVETR